MQRPPSGGLFVLFHHSEPQIRNVIATIARVVHLPCMTQLTFEIAATHDHWFEEPAAKHAYPALKLWWRHLSKQHPIIAQGVEWSGCSLVAGAMVAGTLIASA
jgi:hypothetical protein